MHLSIPYRFQLAALTLALSCGYATAQMPAYCVHDLGTLGGSISQAMAINRFGQVAGNSTTASGQNRAFRTAADLSINALTDDLGALGGAETYASDINSRGQVVGRSMLATGVFHAFRTAPNSAIHAATDDLGTLGGPSSVAYGINDSGQVTGGADTAANREHAFRTAPNHPIDAAAVDVGLLAGTYDGTLVPTYGWRINSLGNLIGTILWQNVTSGYPQGFLFQDGAFAALSIGGYGIFGGINDHNQYVISNDNSSLAFLDGAPTQLCSCNLLAINNSAQMVGSTEFGRGGGLALLYSEGAFYTLNSLIPPGSGWDLQVATAINDRGQIAGYGMINGEIHAFRLDPPPANVLAADIGWLDSLGLLMGNGNALHSLLNAAQSALQKGNPIAAREQILAFENIVRSQTNRTLPADLADQLLTMAEGELQLLLQP